MCIVLYILCIFWCRHLYDVFTELGKLFFYLELFHFLGFHQKYALWHIGLGTADGHRGVAAGTGTVQ